MSGQSRKSRVDSETVQRPDEPIATTSSCRTPSPKRHKDGATNEDFNADEGQADSGDKSYKVFNDSIHGHIEVHPLCVKIIDTPQFQRLRNIKQLGACYHVFPGASHNRFEHCIGTCYLAGKLVRSLKKRQPQLGITDEDVLCIKIAGLCHDLGHGPFSHMFDRVFIPLARPNKNWKHEDASVKMFDHMMNENKLDPIFKFYKLVEKDLVFIKELIAGEDLPDASSTQEWPFKGRERAKRYLYEIVANKTTGIDVDKFDYFSRDCHNLGIGNSFDHKRYIKFARVIDVKGKLQICVRDKEAGNIYHMFHTRNSLFRRAYKHKTTNIIEIMITEAMLKADKNIRFEGSDGETLSISESIEDMKAYTLLTDQVYYQIICSSDPGLQEARSILMRIQTRDLYKYVGEVILKERRKKEEIPVIKQDMAKCIDGEPHIEPDDFIVDLVTFDYGMKDSNPINELRFYAKNNPDKPITLRKEEVSTMLPEKFSEQRIRVYFRKNDPEYKKAKRCFEQWRQRQQCTTPKAGDDQVGFTPTKSSQETDHGNVARHLSFQE